MEKDKLQKIKELIQYLYEEKATDDLLNDFVSLLETCPS